MSRNKNATGSVGTTLMVASLAASLILASSVSASDPVNPEFDLESSRWSSFFWPGLGVQDYFYKLPPRDARNSNSIEPLLALSALQQQQQYQPKSRAGKPRHLPRFKKMAAKGSSEEDVTSAFRLRKRQASDGSSVFRLKKRSIDFTQQQQKRDVFRLRKRMSKAQILENLKPVTVDLPVTIWMPRIRLDDDIGEGGGL